MFVELSNLLPRLHVYEALFPRHERLVQTLSVVYCDLLHFCFDAKDVLRRSKRTVFGASWKSFEKRFAALRQRFSDNELQIEKEVNASNLIESADSRSIIIMTQQELARKTRGPS